MLPLRDVTKRTGWTKCDTQEKKTKFRGDWDFATFGPGLWVGHVHITYSFKIVYFKWPFSLDQLMQGYELPALTQVKYQLSICAEGPLSEDTGSVVNLAMIAFPGTSVAGMEEVYRKIRDQSEAMMEGLMDAAQHLGGNAENRIKVKQPRNTRSNDQSSAACTVHFSLLGLMLLNRKNNFS
jgi:hypothetical protein